jgi:hypothetical protein
MSPEKMAENGEVDFYRDVLGSPRLVVAPMVDASELAWRMLSKFPIKGTVARDSSLFKGTVVRDLCPLVSWAPGTLDCAYGEC